MNEDPIAAHLTELIADAPAPNHEEDNYDAGYVAALADLRDSAAFKLVVEQHANGRIASDLGADPQDYEIAWAAKLRWQARAEKAEAAIARVEAEAALLERMIRTAPWSRYTEVRRSHLRSLGAALEGPGEAG